MIRYRLPIGDWSGDGHGRTEVFLMESEAANIHDVREAFFRARGLVPPNIQPEKLCSSYAENMISAETAREIESVYGYAPWGKLNDEDPDGCYEDICMDAEIMAEITARFITIGGVATRMIPDLTPMLPFYGFDEMGRHIDFIGYGAI